MNLSSFLQILGLEPRRPARRPSRVRPEVEPLEERQLLAGNTISGFVFSDGNNNGRLDPGEGPLANSSIELRNAADAVVGRTVTDANGFYEFGVDTTINTEPAIQRTDLVFSDESPKTQSVRQFDPSLGQLTAVEIQIAGQITTDIKVENRNLTPATVQAVVSGTLGLSAPNLSAVVTTSSDTQTLQASAFDGNLDFGGSSGAGFAPRTVSGTHAVALTSNGELAPYLGTGSIPVTMQADGAASVTGASNLAALTSSISSAQVAVIYHYIPSNRLMPGNYTIVQTVQPAHYLDGQESRDGVVLPNSVGRDAISVVLQDKNLVNNNFGELVPSTLAGSVYADANNDGMRTGGEAGVVGVLIHLTGLNDLGNAVDQVLATATDGTYQFAGLRPGVYAIRETQPAGLLDGKEHLGSLGGSVADDFFSNIALNVGILGANYDFAELEPPKVTPNVAPPASVPPGLGEVGKFQFLASTVKKNRR